MQVETPKIKTKSFKNLDAALDYCKFAEPAEMSIHQVLQDGQLQYQLSYSGSKGEL